MYIPITNLSNSLHRLNVHVSLVHSSLVVLRVPRRRAHQSPMSDATLAAFAADPTAANALQAMVRGDGYRPKERHNREYAFPLLTLARLAEGVTAPTMIHQCRALHAVSDGVTGEALSFAESQRYGMEASPEQPPPSR